MSMDDYADEKERVAEVIDWGAHVDKDKTDVSKGPTGSYGPVGQAVRQSIPHETICSMFCGGKKCYFCSADKWKDDEQAIKGLYSHWVTDNILAMSRPITRLVEEFKIIDQFNGANITAIINVQLAGEHASCGDGNHDQQFSYRQQDFMDKGVFFYNFGWEDFGVAESMSSLLDMVKVMQYAISQGKVAIHCHAGKGRTGVLIAAFLVFHNRMSANEAVHFVRSKRPGSVQTTAQVGCVQEFEKFLKPYRVIFHKHSELPSFNLTQYLMRQRGILHGYQGRKLKFLPKLIYIVCERLLKLAEKSELLHIPTKSTLAVELETSPGALKSGDKLTGVSKSDSYQEDSVLNPKLSKHHNNHKITNGIHGQGAVSAKVRHIGEALVVSEIPDQVTRRVEELQKRLNEDDSAWDELREEENSVVLSTLMWEWLDQLKDPVVRRQDTDLLFDHLEEPQKALDRLDKGARATVTYLMTFLVKLQPIDEGLECEILQKLISVLTQKTLDPSIIPVGSTLASTSTLQSASTQDLRASTNTLTEMREAEKFGIFRFFYNLLETLEDDIESKKQKKPAVQTETAKVKTAAKSKGKKTK